MCHTISWWGTTLLVAVASLAADVRVVNLFSCNCEKANKHTVALSAAVS